MATHTPDSLEWVLAPLAGYTDLPFRRGCRRCGCRRAFTPLIDACALVYGNRHNAGILARGDDEPWLGAQLLGCDPAMMARAAAMLHRLPFEQLDINMGCPVRKVTHKGAGAALPLDPERALRCVAAVRGESPDRPVSVKMRILSEEDAEATAAFARRLEGAGVCAITLHGRLWERIYAGPVWAGVIRAVRESLTIPVTANGGIFSREDGHRLAAASGCQRLMVARGAIGNPWIFRELADAAVAPPSHEEVCAELRQHLEGMVALYGESAAFREGRKIILAYLCGRGYRRSLRPAVSQVATMPGFLALWRQVCAEAPSLSPMACRHRPPLELAPRGG